jgi:predicted Zn finger-like uncharacterized protein
MILTCPACKTRYSADANNFPAEGRDVRCARCGHVWHQAPPVADLDPGIFEDGVDSEPAPGPHEETVDEIRRRQEKEAEAAAARRARLRDAMAPPPTEPEDTTPPLWQVAVGKAIVGAGWLGVMAIVLAAGWAALIYRPLLTQYWPQSASLYATIGMKPDIAALKFATVNYRSAQEDGQPVLTVTGTLVNDSTKEMSVPPIRVALIDAGMHELYRWTFSPAALTLAPGQSTHFSTRISSPPTNARHLELHFAKTGE